MSNVVYIGKYTVLMLFRKDMFADLRHELDGNEVNVNSFRATRRDIEMADRVDFTDRDGTCYTLKVRTVNRGRTAQCISRPDSFQYFNIALPGAY